MKSIKEDFRSAGLDTKTVMLLEYAEKLTIKPYAIVDEDVERLRTIGWDDEQIVLATHVVGIFNYLVRLADAFGIEWEQQVKESAVHQPELWR
ncbi:MAG: carboxymuconolactone decarboxylase family protein [Candidatus Binatia bacterium]